MLGVRDLFRVGIGPSSSHTVGPMKAAHGFAARLRGLAFERVRVDLLGSLAWTGMGHATDKAVMLGLAGFLPDTIEPEQIDLVVEQARAARSLVVAGRAIAFDPDADIVFDRDGETPVHPNTLRLVALGRDGETLVSERWCSIGGGFIVPEERFGEDAAEDDPGEPPFPFRTAAQLLAICRRHGLSIAEVMRANERARASEEELDAYLDRVIAVMMSCIDRGMQTEGVLPGRLKVPRRAPALRQKLAGDRFRNRQAPHNIMDHISLFAIAVNEENAAGGRVVTAPTNGAAGVVPAVLRYYRDFWPDADRAGMHDFLLTAGAIGVLTKLNASISGAEVGCQGEVGTASAMAAAGLAAVMGASDAQTENAAEIAMEHHLGMTCDPVAGLVQVPCIERNAFGAIKAINAASLSLRGDGTHIVSLDQVIETMMRTGTDMHAKYKETSQGGLAVSFPEC
ncbi:L-serine dehydratase [Sphingomonas sp. SORGH_AS 950]|uniref:L-serine ammonia-lyase n=1 Tax=Sphingomonas sp. SORGH_AS_0950 TaxID=3041792 RepID=UPI002780CE1E|nr:L-serine ammonia-lyase [Sphingomonas sp. SORGH_AS_0950]MDQ1155989.1 L-serine dehydratase [Sphingomonas sp. SORGH_AS_0950]